MSSKPLFVKLAQIAEQSTRYQASKHFFNQLIIHPRSRMRPYFDGLMIILILSSIFMLVFGVTHERGRHGRLLEEITLAIFAAEYLLRLWLCSDSHRLVLQQYEKSRFTGEKFSSWRALKQIVNAKVRYMLTPLALIDLLALLPAYRPLKILRFFLLFRLLKLFRYARSVTEFAKVVSEKRFELMTLAAYMGFIIFGAATAIYIFEQPQANSPINSFNDAMYWAIITVSTVGYGDITPATTEGRLVAYVLVFSGMGGIAFTTSILVASFSEKLKELQKIRVYNNLEKDPEHIVIAGFGRLGQQVADKLIADNRRVLILDIDEDKVEQARNKGLPALHTDIRDDGDISELGLDHTTAMVLILSDDDIANVYLSLSVKEISPDMPVIARANHEAAKDKLLAAGASHVVSTFEVLGSVVAEYLDQSIALDTVLSVISGQVPVHMNTLRIESNHVLCDQRLDNIRLHELKLRIFGIVQAQKADGPNHYPMVDGRFWFNPDPAYYLQAGDQLVLLAHQDSMAYLRRLLAKNATKELLNAG